MFYVLKVERLPTIGILLEQNHNSKSRVDHIGLTFSFLKYVANFYTVNDS